MTVTIRDGERVKHVPMPEDVRTHREVPQLRRMMAERVVGVSELAREADLNRTVIYDALSGKAITRTSLRKIAMALAKFPVMSELEASLLDEAG
jgi:predicted transcriptional regulator